MIAFAVGSSQQCSCGSCGCKHRYNNYLQALKRGGGHGIFFEKFPINRSDGRVGGAWMAGQSSLAREIVNGHSSNLTFTAYTCRCRHQKSTVRSRLWQAQVLVQQLPRCQGYAQSLESFLRGKSDLFTAFNYCCSQKKVVSQSRPLRVKVAAQPLPQVPQDRGGCRWKKLKLQSRLWQVQVPAQQLPRCRRVEGGYTRRLERFWRGKPGLHVDKLTLSSSLLSTPLYD
jgi:hypothetical protein